MPLLNVPPSRLPRLYWTSSRPRNLPIWTKTRSKRSVSSIRDGRFKKEDRGYLWCCFRDETKQRFDRATWQTSPRRGLSPPLQPARKRPRELAPRCGQRPATHPAAPPEAKPSPCSKASAKTCPRHQVKPHRQSLHLRVPPTDSATLHCSRTCTFSFTCELTALNEGRVTCLGVASRQFDAALSSAGVMKSRNWGKRVAKKENERGKEPAKDGPSNSKREGWGRRRWGTTRGHAAGLLQLRSLTSYLLLRFPSASPSHSSHARRSELCQQTADAEAPDPCTHVEAENVKRHKSHLVTHPVEPAVSIPTVPHPLQRQRTIRSPSPSIKHRRAQLSAPSHATCHIARPSAFLLRPPLGLLTQSPSSGFPSPCPTHPTPRSRPAAPPRTGAPHRSTRPSSMGAPSFDCRSRRTPPPRPPPSATTSQRCTATQRHHGLVTPPHSFPGISCPLPLSFPTHQQPLRPHAATSTALRPGTSTCTITRSSKRGSFVPRPAPGTTR